MRNRSRYLPAGHTALAAAAALSLLVGVGCVTDGQTQTVELAVKASTATLKVSCGGQGELVVRDPQSGAARKVTSKDSMFSVPAGPYQLLYYTRSAKDEEGRLWRGMSMLSSGRGTTFALRDGEEKTVQAGPPYKARVDVRKGQGRIISLDLKVTDVGGATSRVGPKVGQTANPSFTVTDRDGRVVLTGQFEYG